MSETPTPTHFRPGHGARHLKPANASWLPTPVTGSDAVHAILGEMEPMGRTFDYLAMKRAHLRRTPEIEFMMALAIVMVLAGLIYYGRLVWLLFSPD
jgi:hypothetical protein